MKARYLVELDLQQRVGGKASTLQLMQQSFLVAYYGEVLRQYLKYFRPRREVRPCDLPSQQFFLHDASNDDHVDAK